MVLPRQYLRVGQNARNRLFGFDSSTTTATTTTTTAATTAAAAANQRQHQPLLFDDSYSPIQMLISQRGQLHKGRLICVIIAVIIFTIGFLLTTIPWVDYLILNNLRLSNGSLSHRFWQKPGLMRLTKVYIFNITNSESFLTYNERPKFVEIGPFVYREDMEKVNVKFHDNDTVSYQHKKILKFVPEMSLPINTTVTVPNIPLLTLSSTMNMLHNVLQFATNFGLGAVGYGGLFKVITAHELFFGYEDKLMTIAQYVYPKNKRPFTTMGLLIGRNGTLDEIQTIYTGQNMSRFGYLNRINGRETFHFWSQSPCNNIEGSEGSFFPPRVRTQANLVYLYDKDVCRLLPFRFRRAIAKDGIPVDLYTMDETAFASVETEPKNRCFCLNDECPEKGLQNISPCQFGAPVYLSQPHFLDADPQLLRAVEGLAPNRSLHESFFKIQPKLGVPLEGQIRIQLNIRVEKNQNFRLAARFPSITYPVIWLEEGVSDLGELIKWWIYFATVIPDNILPVITFGMILAGTLTLAIVFVVSYKDIVFNPQTIEIGMRTLRRHSSALFHTTNRLLTSVGGTNVGNGTVTDSYMSLNAAAAAAGADS